MAWKQWLGVLVRKQGAEQFNPDDLPVSLGDAWQMALQQTGLTDEGLAQAAAQLLGLPLAEFSNLQLDVAGLLPQAEVERRMALPLRMSQGRLQAALADPSDSDTLNLLRFASRHESIEPQFASPPVLQAQIEAIFGGGKALAKARPPTQAANAAKTPKTAKAPDKGKGNADDAAFDAVSEHEIVELARELLNRSARLEASDIHIQPQMGGIVVRLRVYGLLRRERLLTKAVGEQLIRHFMVMGEMDTSQMRTPQDGRHYLVLESGERYDLRISLLPVYGGQSLVIRLLHQGRSFALEQLGFATADRMTLRRAVGRHAGMVLFAGPTGSGKTTSLYALMAGLNRPEVSLTTVEDPVEYVMPGLKQVEINEKRGTSYEAVVQALVRQDPNIVLIGEIRNGPSATAAAQMALAGRLVLSTLHASSARGAIARLQALGMSEHVIGEALVAVVAQRLVRKLCTYCAVPVIEPLQPKEHVLETLTGERPAMRAVGCPECGHTGYAGRLPIVDIFMPTPEVRMALVRGAFNTVEERVDARGDALAWSAFALVVSGESSLDEAERVLGYDFWDGVARKMGKPSPLLNLSSSAFGEEEYSHPRVLAVGLAEERLKDLSELLGSQGYLLTPAMNLPEASVLLKSAEDIYCVVCEISHLDEQEAIRELRDVRKALAWSGIPFIWLIPPGLPQIAGLLAQRAPGRFMESTVRPDQILEAVQKVLG